MRDSGKKGDTVTYRSINSVIIVHAALMRHKVDDIRSQGQYLPRRQPNDVAMYKLPTEVAMCRCVQPCLVMRTPNLAFAQDIAMYVH